MDKRNLKQTAGCFVWFFGIMFLLSSIGMILTVVTGGNLSKYFTDGDGESTFSWYKIQFWVMIVSLVVLLASGGKIKNLLKPNGYKDAEGDLDNNSTFETFPQDPIREEIKTVFKNPYKTALYFLDEPVSKESYKELLGEKKFIESEITNTISHYHFINLEDVPNRLSENVSKLVSYFDKDTGLLKLQNLEFENLSSALLLFVNIMTNQGWKHITSDNPNRTIGKSIDGKHELEMSSYKDFDGKFTAVLQLTYSPNGIF